MKALRNFTFIAVIFTFASFSYAQPRIQVGTFSTTTIKYSDGCGTVLRPPGMDTSQLAVFADTGEGVWMKLNGKMIALTFVSSTQPRNPKKGQKFTNRYKGGVYSVKVRYTVKGFTDDAIDLNALITVSKGKLITTARAEGYSGC